MVHLPHLPHKAGPARPEQGRCKSDGLLNILQDEVVRSTSVEDNSFASKAFLICLHNTERLPLSKGAGASSFQMPCIVRCSPRV